MITIWHKKFGSDRLPFSWDKQEKWLCGCQDKAFFDKRAFLKVRIFKLWNCFIACFFRPELISCSIIGRLREDLFAKPSRSRCSWTFHKVWYFTAWHNSRKNFNHQNSVPSFSSSFGFKIPLLISESLNTVIKKSSFPSGRTAVKTIIISKTNISFTSKNCLGNCFCSVLFHSQRKGEECFCSERSFSRYFERN